MLASKRTPSTKMSRVRRELQFLRVVASSLISLMWIARTDRRRSIEWPEVTHSVALLKGGVIMVNGARYALGG